MVPVSSISIRGEEEYQSEKRRKHFNQASDPKGVHKKKVWHATSNPFFLLSWNVKKLIENIHKIE